MTAHSGVALNTLSNSSRCIWYLIHQSLVAVRQSGITRYLDPPKRTAVNLRCWRHPLEMRGVQMIHLGVTCVRSRRCDSEAQLPDTWPCLSVCHFFPVTSKNIVSTKSSSAVWWWWCAKVIDIQWERSTSAWICFGPTNPIVKWTLTQEWFQWSYAANAAAARLQL